MSHLQAKLLALAALLSATLAASDPCPTTCYTATVPATLNCPLLPALTTPCVVPDCILITTTTIPGPNAACPTTPTITASGSCPTTATCRHTCERLTTTVTGPACLGTLPGDEKGPTSTATGVAKRSDPVTLPGEQKSTPVSLPGEQKSTPLVRRSDPVTLPGEQWPCSSTVTVTRPVPCPLVVCGAGTVVCPLEAREVVPREVEAVTTASASASASACPVTVIVPSKCPTCTTSCPPLVVTPTTLVSVVA